MRHDRDQAVTAGALPAAATIPDHDRQELRWQRGGRVGAIIAAGLVAPMALAGAYFAAANGPIAGLLNAPSETLRQGAHAVVRAVATLVLGGEAGVVYGLAPTKPPGAQCLTMADPVETPLLNAVHMPGADAGQSSPSIECLPPMMTVPAKPAVQMASLSNVHDTPRPVVLKELPRAVQRQPQAVASPSAKLTMQGHHEAPEPAARNAGVGYQVKTVIINKTAALAPPEGMKVPGFSARAEPVTEAPQQQLLGVTGLVPPPPLGGPGTVAQKPGAIGKTQNAQAGLSAKRPPEQLPWLLAEGEARRSSLGRTGGGDTVGRVEIFGTAVPVGTPSWSKDLYKNRN
jgi:hypothetical protein